MNELTRREEDNDMTGSIYHNTSMSQRPIRGDCEYHAGTGADVRKWKTGITRGINLLVRKYGDRGGCKEEPGQFII
jgi:hypothetical protein